MSGEAPQDGRNIGTKLAADDGNVIVQFSAPVTHLTMSPLDAVIFMKSLAEITVAALQQEKSPIVVPRKN